MSKRNMLLGHSGCELLLMQDNSPLFVRKISSNAKYNNRLKKQYIKQHKYIDSEYVLSPKVIKTGFLDDKFYFDMEFIKGRTLAEHSKYISLKEISKFITILFNSLDTQNTQLSKNANEIFNNKIETLLPNLPNLLTIKNAISILQNFDWKYVYKSKCHGDLTLENIIVTANNKLYLIDYLDSFYNSWLIDIAKLLQDLELKWSFRKETINTTQSIRLLVAKEALFKKILSLDNNYELITTIYHILLLNILRIYPYTNDNSTLLYLEDVLNFLLQKIASIKKERL